MESVQKQLEELGLSPNEVRVYLAGLESGAATAQQLAAKAAVVRPTAYVAIGGLVKRGLMSSYTKGKKQYFVSGKPEQLLHLVQDEKRKIAERESKLKSLLPGLESLIAISGEKPEVKLYEGLEGLAALHDFLFESGAKHIDVIESFLKTVPDNTSLLHHAKLMRSAITGRNLFIVEKKQEVISKIFKKQWKYKFLIAKNFEYNGEIAIFSNYVVFIAYRSKPHGVLINSKDLAGIARMMFDRTWKSIS